jgi:hypothetical protein
MWDEMAERAANPDSSTIAKHDAITRQIDKLMQSNGDAGQIAQLKIQADDLFDWRYKHHVAQQCWSDLRIIHEDNEGRLRLLAARSASARAPSVDIPDPKGYALDTRPPPPVSPPPGADLGDMYKHVPPAHGCIGMVPVQGPGLNPCPPP